MFPTSTFGAPLHYFLNPSTGVLLEIQAQALRAFRSLSGICSCCPLEGATPVEDSFGREWFRLTEQFILESALVDSLVPDQARIWQITNEPTTLQKVFLSGPFYLPGQRQQLGQQLPTLQALVRFLQPRRPEVIGAVGEDTPQGACWWPLDHGTVEGQNGSTGPLEQLESPHSHWEQVQMGKTLIVLRQLADGRQIVQEVNDKTYFIKKYHHPFIAELNSINDLDLYSIGVTG